MKPPVVLPIDGANDRCLIEIDIVPTAKACKRMVFYLKRKNESKRRYFFRTATESKKYNDNKKERIELHERVNDCAKRRQEEVYSLNKKVFANTS